MKIIIETPAGDRYLIDPKNGNINGSSNWRFLGIRRVHGGCFTNDFIPLSQLTQEKVEEIDWLFKNGVPRWTVDDLDYGTHRSWGNTHYHGIRFFYYVEDNNEYNPA